MIRKTVVKLLLSDILFESRDKKEIALLQEIGCEVRVLCSGEKTEKLTTNEGLSIQRIGRLPRNQAQPKLIRATLIIKRLLLFKRFLQSYNADCISCHDIFALFIAWTSTWFIPRKRKPFLVYDSHEFEIGRNTGGKRGRIIKYLVGRTEKFLMKRCAFSIMVNDSIADVIQKIHKLKDRPIVVRNIPPYWNVDEAECQKQRTTFCNAVNVDSNTFIAMYHGMITGGRGIESFIKAIGRVENTIGVILGYGEGEYIQSLKDLAVSENVSGRILFHPAVPSEELWKYIGAANTGIIVVEILCKSYYYGLGNKFFENIQSMTPIICNNTPEMANIINKYDIGLTVEPPGDLQSLITAIVTMRTNQKLYTKFIHNLKRAKSELNWEEEKEMLINAYSKILQIEK